MYDATTAEKICSTMTASVPLWNIEDTTDDKTIVCLINENAQIKVPKPEYFYEPDWAKLRQHYEHLLYPAGFSGEDPLAQPQTPGGEEEESSKNRKKGGFFKSVFRNK